jgi:hypothetical protein
MCHFGGNMDYNNIISQVDSYAEKKRLDPICKKILCEFCMRSYKLKLYPDSYLSAKLSNLNKELTAMKIVEQKEPTDYLGYHVYNEVYLCSKSINNIAVDNRDEAVQTIIAGFHELSHNTDINVKMDRKLPNDISRSGYERWCINTLDDEVNTIITSYILMYNVKNIDDLKQVMVMHEINRQCFSGIKIIDNFCKALNINLIVYIRKIKKGENAFVQETALRLGDDKGISRFFLLKKILIYYTTQMEAYVSIINDETKSEKAKAKVTSKYQKMLPLYKNVIDEFNSLCIRVNEKAIINDNQLETQTLDFPGNNESLINHLMLMITERKLSKAQEKPKYVLFRNRKDNHGMTDRDQLINELKKQRVQLLSQNAGEETKIVK